MSAHNHMGRSGGSSESPGRAPLADEVVDFLLHLILALWPMLVIGGLGAGMWWHYPTMVAIAATIALVVFAVLTGRRQWRWFRGVFFRRGLPTKLRQVGVINRTGQTPPVKSVRWRGPIVTVYCSTRLGHPRQLFEQHAAGLAAAMGAESVSFEQVKSTIVITAVRRSAFTEEQTQSWT